jgi:hypothetical protein
MRTFWLGLMLALTVPSLTIAAPAPQCCVWRTDWRKVCDNTDCTAVRKVWLNVCGRAPADSTVCEASMAPFPGPTKLKWTLEGRAQDLRPSDPHGWQLFHLSSSLVVGGLHLSQIYLLPPAACLGKAERCPTRTGIEVTGALEWRSMKRVAEGDTVDVPLLVAKEARLSFLERALGTRKK